MSKYVDELRKSIGEGDQKRDLGLSTPIDIERFDDIHYGENNLQILDIYKPKKYNNKKLPVIVSVHGGGWVYGTKEVYQYYCMSLAQNGFAVVNFSYRLAPEYKFPAAIEDTNSVFSWIFDNADRYNLDINNIFALGDSAGGNILTLFIDALINKDYNKNFSFSPKNEFVPKAVALNCGAYNPILCRDDGVSDERLMEELLEGGITEKGLNLVNSIQHIKEGFPPSFVMTCEGDFLLNQMKPLCEKLMEVKTPFIARYYKSDDILLEHVFHCNIKLKEASICNKEECRFFMDNIS